MILALAAVIFAGAIAWQIAACYMAKTALQSEMDYLTAQLDLKTGLTRPLSEDELRNAVIEKAKEQGVELEPQQVTVEKTVTSDKSVIHLAVDYDGRVNVIVYSFRPHFTLTSTGSSQLAMMR